MFDSLSQLDLQLFTLVNQRWTGPVPDTLFVLVTDFKYLAVPLGLVLLYLLWRSDPRERAGLLVAVLAVIVADTLSMLLKTAVDRSRPYEVIEAARVLVGKSRHSPSMPSNHAANVVAAAMALGYVWRRRKWVVATVTVLAAAVCYSRVYTGVHFPTDVLVGALIGAVTAACLVAVDIRWPLYTPGEEGRPGRVSWTAAVILLTVLLTVVRLQFINDRYYNLTPEETQYWDWSRRLAWGYFSKPPLIAWLIRLFTSIGGNTAFAVRMVSVALSVLFTWAAFRTVIDFSSGRERAAFFAFVTLAFSPLFAAGAILVTTDVPQLVSWSVALFFAGRAMFGGVRGGDDGRSGRVVAPSPIWWYGMGAAIGVGMLAKYAMIYFPLCLLLFLVFTPSARAALRCRHFYLGLVLAAVISSPPLVWNAVNGWISAKHVAADAAAGGGLQFNPLWFFDFVGSQMAVIGPVLLPAMLWLAWTTLRRYRADLTDRERFLLWFSLPILAGFALKSFTGKIQGNWAASAYISLAYFAAIRWDEALLVAPARTRARRRLAYLAVAVLATSLPVFGLMHYSNLLRKAGVYPARNIDPLRPLFGWSHAGLQVGDAVTTMPQPARTLVLANRYQIAAEMAFYVPGQPPTYVVGGKRRSQYDLWGGLDDKAGWDAVFMTEDDGLSPPAFIADSFERVEPAQEVVSIVYDHEYFDARLFRCHNLRAPEVLKSGGRKEY